MNRNGLAWIIVAVLIIASLIVAYPDLMPSLWEFANRLNPGNAL